MYTYKAYVTSVWDADTFRCDIDLGFGIIFKNQSIRMLGINAPEIRGEENKKGIKSRDALRKRILNKDIILTTQKDDKEKFGRYLGEVSIDNENINDWLVKNKFAVLYGKETA